MIYEEFCQLCRDHVVTTCRREMDPSIVDEQVKSIYKRAYEGAQTGDKEPQHYLMWSLVAAVEQHRTPERRAASDAQWAAYEAATQ